MQSCIFWSFTNTVFFDAFSFLVMLDCSFLMTADGELDRGFENFRQFSTSSPSKIQRPQCSICGKSFFDASNLRRHFEIHSADRKKFMCLLCDKQFAWKTHLFTHLKSSHSIFENFNEHFALRWWFYFGFLISYVTWLLVYYNYVSFSILNYFYMP